MKLPKRAVYMLLLALVCVNILVRLPRTDHETGIDSFFIHSLATAVTQEGRIPWVLNPLGYFGWYPLSYPSAGPVLISGVSQVTVLTGESTILALTLLYGVLGALLAFAMARAFRQDDTFALLVAVLFSLAPRFVSSTLWSASSRNLFMVLGPLFVLSLVWSYRRPSASNLLILISVLILMMATHRLTILLAVVVIAFVAAYVLVLFHRVMRVRLPKILLSRKFRRWMPWLAIFGVVAIAAFMLLGTQVLNEYSEGEVCSGDSMVPRLCNLAVSVTRSVGLALPFALIGVFTLTREHNRGFLEAFLAFSLLALIPTLFLRQYTGFYILPFLSLFAGFGVLGIVKTLRRRPRTCSAVLLATVVVVSGFSVAVLQVEIERGTSMSGSIYSTALYLRSLPPGNFVANDGLLGVRVASISGRGGLPVGGAGTTHQSPELLVIRAFNATEVFEGEYRIPLTELTIEDDSPFLLLGVDALRDWDVRIMQSPVDEVDNELVERYRLAYYLENDAFRDAYVAFGNVYDTRKDPGLVAFPVSMHAARYKIYDGTSEDLYWVWEASG